MRRRTSFVFLAVAALAGFVAFVVAYRTLPAEPDVRVRLPAAAKYDSTGS